MENFLESIFRPINTVCREYVTCNGVDAVRLWSSIWLLSFDEYADLYHHNFLDKSRVLIHVREWLDLLRRILFIWTCLKNDESIFENDRPTLRQFRQRKAWVTQTNHWVKGIVCLLSQAWWECLSLFTEASLFLHLTLSICSPKSLPFLSDPLSHACRLSCYIPWNFSDNSLSLSLAISFKISATTNFNSLLSFQFYLRNSFILAYLHVDIYKNTHLLTNHFSVFPRHILFSTPAIFNLELFNLPRQTFHSSNSWSNDLEPTSSRVFTICSSGGSELPLLRHRASFLLAAAGTFISLISKYSQPGLEICGVHVLLLPRLFVYHPNWVIKLAFLNLGCLNHFKS